MTQTQNPITNPIPKDRFLSQPRNVSEHRQMVDSEAFQRGVDFALLHYQALLAMRVGDFNTCAANHIRMQGALEFLQEFRLLSEVQRAPKPTIVEGLNHRV